MSALFLSGCSYALIEPGHRGLLFDPAGSLRPEVLPPGSYHLSTLCMHKCPHIEDFDVTYSTREVDIRTSTAEGLPMDVRLAVIYRPIISELYALDTESGRNYYDDIIGPEFRSAARSRLATTRYREVLSREEKLEDEIEADLQRRLNGKHVEIASVTIESVRYPPEIDAASCERFAREHDATPEPSSAR